MRRGLLKKVQLTDGPTQRLQSNIADAIEVLASDHDVLSVPVAAHAATGAIAAGRSVVVYQGAPGATLTLPPAAAQGPTIGALVAVCNRSTGAITVAAAPNETIGAAVSVALAASVAALYVSDGVDKWFAV